MYKDYEVKKDGVVMKAQFRVLDQHDLIIVKDQVRRGGYTEARAECLFAFISMSGCNITDQHGHFLFQFRKNKIGEMEYSGDIVTFAENWMPLPRWAKDILLGWCRDANPFLYLENFVRPGVISPEPR